MTFGSRRERLPNRHPGGSGIGLLLCRQIAEAHDGRLGLENAAGGGAAAELRFPLAG